MTQFDNVLPIWGIQKESELDEWLSYNEVIPVMNDDIKTYIEKEKKELSGDFCRGCGYCMPCPVGIQINQCARMSLMLRRAPSDAWLTSQMQAEMKKIVKEAEGIQRVMAVTTPSTINRNVHSLDDVTIKMVPAARMKTKYNFTEGCVAAEDAKQINFILIHPTCVVCRDKYSYIKLFTPGTDSRTADGYLYQNRNYGDLFLLEKKVEGCIINAEAAGA